jgi:hypothetical protein
MGYNLLNVNDDYFRFNFLGWPNILVLAYAYGWEPAGTLEPSLYDPETRDPILLHEKPWDPMNYTSNSYQWVTNEDAANMADALEKFLGDVPAIHDLYEISKRLKVWLGSNGVTEFNNIPVSQFYVNARAIIGALVQPLREEGFEVRLGSSEMDELNTHSFACWCKNNRQKIKAFIQFCRKGGFDIG